jgi:hypothetical protein
MEIDLHRMTGTGWEAPPTTLLNCCEYDLRGGAFRLYANLGTRFSSSAKAAWRVSTFAVIHGYRDTVSKSGGIAVIVAALACASCL